MYSIRRIGKTAALGVLPYCLFMMVAPVNRAGAYQASIFTALLGTVTGPLGGALKQINAAENTLHTVTQVVAFPTTLINSAHSFISTSSSRYGSYMNQVSSTRISSATLPTTQSFENTLNTGGTASNAIFYSTFGSPLNKAAQQPTSVMQQQNMSDAASLGGIDLAGRATTSSSTTVSLSNTMQNTAGSVSPGNADLLTAQAQATILASMAVEHQLLAAQIRLEASSLADQSLSQKRAIASASGTPLAMDKQ